MFLLEFSAWHKKPRRANGGASHFEIRLCEDAVADEGEKRDVFRPERTPSTTRVGVERERDLHRYEASAVEEQKASRLCVRWARPML